MRRLALAGLIALTLTTRGSSQSLLLLGAGTSGAAAAFTVAFGTLSSSDDGTTQLLIPYPASISAGDLLVACVVNKYPTNAPTDPSEFALPSNARGEGGSGSAGVDTGTVYASVYVKVAEGDESGNLTVDITSGNAGLGYIARYTKTGGTWSYAATNGADNTASGTTWVATGAGDPGVQSGDILIACTGQNSNDYAHSAHSFTQTGITFGSATERGEIGSTQGDDLRVIVADAAATAGTSSAAPVYNATHATAGTDAPAGASVILRIRAS